MSDIPDKCPFCGADYHGEGKTDKWEWTQYKCSTEFENGEWLQDDDCRIAQLDNTITALRTDLAEAKQRVAELESGINEGRLALRSFVDDAAFVKSDSVLVDSVMDVASFLAALLPANRINNIPGKEDHDGEMQ